MARIRTVKPGFFSDEGLAGCSPHARLLAIALLQMADVEGRILDVPMQIHAHAFPWETTVNTQVLLGELERVDYVFRYEFEGKRYLLLPGFVKHQRITGKEATAGSSLPGPEGKSLKCSEEVGGDSQGNNGETPGCFSGEQLEPQEEEEEEEEEGIKTLVRESDEENQQLARWMFAAIRKVHDGHRKPNFDRWARSIRLMRDRDGRTPEQFRDLYAWVMAEPFWRSHVLSPEKFREKWDQLVVRRGATGLSADSEQGFSQEVVNGSF